ncbi:hypothetical protein PYCC9005_002381 [Savitreella phatthalungensis]
MRPGVGPSSFPIAPPTLSDSAHHQLWSRASASDEQIWLGNSAAATVGSDSPYYFANALTPSGTRLNGGDWVAPNDVDSPGTALVRRRHEDARRSFRIEQEATISRLSRSVGPEQMFRPTVPLTQPQTRPQESITQPLLTRSLFGLSSHRQDQNHNPYSALPSRS